MSLRLSSWQGASACSGSRFLVTSEPSWSGGEGRVDPQAWRLCTVASHLLLWRSLVLVGSIMSLECTLWQENVSLKGTMLAWSRLTGRGPTAATEPLNKGVGQAGTSPRGVGFWMQQGKPCPHPRMSCDRDIWCAAGCLGHSSLLHVSFSFE